MAGIINKVKQWFSSKDSFDVFMQRITMYLLYMDFLILILPYLEFPFLGDYVTITQPNKDIMPVYERILKDLHLYIIGAYVFKKIGKYAVQGIVSIAVMRTGGDINKALEAIREDDKPLSIEIPGEQNAQGHNQAANI
jgi:hypothetical protein